MAKNYALVFLVMLTFFVISIITNIVGPLIPELIDDFNLNLTLAALMPFSFFIAYGLTSIPAGILLERYGEKSMMVGAFGLAFAGALLFALFPGYLVAIASLFILGTGMAVLQVVINPLLRVAGGEANLAFFSTMGQMCFGLASFLSPLAYAWVVAHYDEAIGNGSEWLSRLVPAEISWISLYWVFACIALAMVLVIPLFRFPRVELKEDEKSAPLATYMATIRKPVVIRFFLAIFFYVGSEQGVANWISEFLSSVHGFDPQTMGARAVSRFWGLMTVGTLVGLFLVKLMDSRRLLILFTWAAMGCLLAALVGSAETAYFSLPMIGFFAAVMWPVILSLALNSVEEHHGSFSGILMTGIAGGALVPLIIGWLGDLFHLKAGLAFLFLSFGYVLSVGFWARPLINNDQISLVDLFRGNRKARS